MKNYYIFFLVACITKVIALSHVQINQNLQNINAEIININKNINQQENKLNTLTQSIKQSETLLTQYNILITKLETEQNFTQTQLETIQQATAKIQNSIESAQASTKFLIKKIYQKLQAIQFANQSILSGNMSMQQRSETLYLEHLLIQQQNKLKILNEKLVTLNQLNSELQEKIAQIKQQLNISNKQYQKLAKIKSANFKQIEMLNQQMNIENQHLQELQTQQTELKHILSNIKQQNTNNQSTKLQTLHFENAKKINPVTATIQTAFGKNNNFNNRGIVYNTKNNDKISAICDGKVLFVGILPKFGKVIIIDHGDDYMSIYSGLKPIVLAEHVVKTGETIGYAQNASQQILGGTYFELRHHGIAIDPKDYLK